MGEPIPIPLGLESTPGRHGPDAGAEHINVYAEPVPDGVSNAPLYTVDGLDAFSTLTDGSGWRGGIVIGDTA